MLAPVNAAGFPALFRDPLDGATLRRVDDRLVSGRGEVARLLKGIWRFVDPERNYARSFGLQWNHWRDVLSDSRRTDHAKFDLIMQRSHLDRYELKGKRILECGMGGGDDTEVLLQLPFADVYSFDLSTSVERAASYLSDPRLTIFQASITEIPVPDASFDVVYCHRVLQHTPDPLASLRAIIRKLAPGGILFAHCYQRSAMRMKAFKYKYRPITTRVPPEWVLAFVEQGGPTLRALSRWLNDLGRPGRAIREQWVPYVCYESYGALGEEALAELSMHDTFDALTPRFDLPLTQEEFYGEIERAGLRIESRQTNPRGPLWCTAILPGGGNT
jgi:SAM-dependent methyltransferase